MLLDNVLVCQWIFNFVDQLYNEIQENWFSMKTDETVCIKHCAKVYLLRVTYESEG